MKTGCARQQVAPATLNCTSSRSVGRSQARRQPALSRARTLDGDLARGYQHNIRTLYLTVNPADLTACQSKSNPLQVNGENIR